MGFVSIYLFLVRLLVTHKRYGSYRKSGLLRCFLIVPNTHPLSLSLSLSQPSHDDWTALAVKRHTHTLAFLIVRIISLNNCCNISYGRNGR